MVQKRLTADAGATGERGRTEGIVEGNDNEDTKNVARYGRLKEDRNAGDWLTVGTDLPKTLRFIERPGGCVFLCPSLRPHKRPLRFTKPAHPTPTGLSVRHQL